MTVRRATLDDIPIIRKLSNEFWQTYHPYGSYEPNYFLSMLAAGMEDDVFLALLLNETEGMFLGVMSTPYYSSQPAARELVWYTRPSVRGNGMRLFYAFENWARDKGAKYITCGLAQETPALERMGFHKVGVEYMRDINYKRKVHKKSA